ncbi:MAG: hypothetical protein U1A78_00890 [Polyangia bacterium]
MPPSASQPPLPEPTPPPAVSPTATASVSSGAWAPHFGARFQLERQSVDEQVACYAATVHLPEGPRGFSLVIRLPGGEVALTPADAEAAAAPEWTVRHLASLARQLYRGSRKDEGWPRRLMRWHAAEQQAAERGRAMSAAARSPSDAAARSPSDAAATSPSDAAATSPSDAAATSPSDAAATSPSDAAAPGPGPADSGA